MNKTFSFLHGSWFVVIERICSFSLRDLCGLACARQDLSLPLKAKKVRFHFCSGLRNFIRCSIWVLIWGMWFLDSGIEGFALYFLTGFLICYNWRIYSFSLWGLCALATDNVDLSLPLYRRFEVHEYWLICAFFTISVWIHAYLVRLCIPVLISLCMHAICVWKCLFIIQNSYSKSCFTQMYKHTNWT